jgi:short-subunit dehydrogenase
VSKHGAIAVTEALHFELKRKGAAHISVHVLMPGVVATDIQPNANKLLTRKLSPAGQASVDRFQHNQQTYGMSPAHVAKQAFKAIAGGMFYIAVDHPDDRYTMNFMQDGKARYERIESGELPVLKRSPWDIVMASKEQHKAKL